MARAAAALASIVREQLADAVSPRILVSRAAATTAATRCSPRPSWRRRPGRSAARVGAVPRRGARSRPSRRERGESTCRRADAARAYDLVIDGILGIGSSGLIGTARRGARNRRGAAARGPRRPAARGRGRPAERAASRHRRGGRRRAAGGGHGDLRRGEGGIATARGPALCGRVVLVDLGTGAERTGCGGRGIRRPHREGLTSGPLRECSRDRPSVAGPQNPATECAPPIMALDARSVLAKTPGVRGMHDHLQARAGQLPGLYGFDLIGPHRPISVDDSRPRGR